MLVVLINPPHPYLIDPDSQAPLGLLYVASCIRRAGEDVVLANLSKYSVEDGVKLLPKNADLYGITATSVDFHLCVDLANKIREFKYDAKIILGGPHASLENARSTAIDSICIGEAENVIPNILEDVKQNTLSPTYIGKRIKNLDSYPYPSRELMDIRGGQIFAHGRRYGSGESTVISGSRGCPFSCAFCASPALWGRKVVYRSVDSLIAEISYVKRTYGITEFRFSDDTMNLNKKRLHDFCKKVGPLDIFWRCSARAGLSDEKTFKMMYDAGCREICPGIESGDQRVLDTLKKGNSVADNINLVNAATKVGINVRMLIMTGTPGEYFDTPEKNKKFLDSVDFDSVAIKQFRPLPGSAIYMHPEKFDCKILDYDVSKYNFYFWHNDGTGERTEAPIESVIELKDLSKEDLEKNMLRMRAYAVATGKCNRG